VRIVAGVDLGGNAINYTLMTEREQFLIEGLCEHPARSTEGPEICVQQMVDGLKDALERAGFALSDVAIIGLDTPGPASTTGVLSSRGSTNFVHRDWAGYDIRAGLETKLDKPVTYLNDGNAAALWGHFTLFGASAKATSVSAIIGTGLGGGVIVEDIIVKGRAGFGGEVGHVLIPYQSIPGLDGMSAYCNCGRNGCLESTCSLSGIARNLLPHFLPKYPGHELANLGDMKKSAKRVRGMAEAGDEMCRYIFQIQARSLSLFFDQMVNVFDPDALIVGGGAIETSGEFQEWFISEIRAGMPTQRSEQKDIPIRIMPDGDTAGARGAALEALAELKRREKDSPQN
jgi:predicted NBD/HSP70 family sugar kinase